MMNVMEKVLAKKKEPSDVLSLVFSNFAQTSEKQKKPNLEKIFSLLSKSFEIQAKNREKDAVLKRDRQELVGTMQKTVEDDVNRYYTDGLDLAARLRDRGVLRAFTWGKKVATIQKTLLGRFISQGDAAIGENDRIQVCEACGFMMIKESSPDICPVCKAPAKRFVTL